MQNEMRYLVFFTAGLIEQFRQKGWYTNPALFMIYD